MTNDQKLFWHCQYIKPHEKKKLETFDQRIDSMQWLILYSHQNDNVLNEW